VPGPAEHELRVRQVGDLDGGATVVASVYPGTQQVFARMDQADLAAVVALVDAGRLTVRVRGQLPTGARGGRAPGPGGGIGSRQESCSTSAEYRGGR